MKPVVTKRDRDETCSNKTREREMKHVVTKRDRDDDCPRTFLILQQDAWTFGAPFPAPFAKPESIFCILGMDLDLQRVPPSRHQK